MPRNRKEIPGRPLQVVKIVDHKFELQENDLKSILHQDNLKNMGVVVVSVAGAFRKGKSFLLNLFLRFLEVEGSDKWIGSKDEPLTGFSWCGGSDRETTGIWMWSHAFVCPGPNGEEVAVLLMDTQGTFDTESTLKESTTIFALSTMLSSVQVYNLSMDIQEDDLQNLQFFTEYGRLALKQSNCKPYQNLMFLVRDWQNPHESEYGLEGGRKHLDKRLKIKEKQPKEIQTVREHIGDAFKEIQCFLMPYPGHKIARRANRDGGRVEDISAEFCDEINVLARRLLSSENLVIKENNGNIVTCADLEMYFKKFIKIFQEDELPEPKTIFQANAELNNSLVGSNALEVYKRAMDNVCGGDKPYIKPNILQEHHNYAMENAIKHFEDLPKMGGKSFSEPFYNKLLLDIMKLYSDFEHNNKVRLPFIYKAKAFVVNCFSITSRHFAVAGADVGACLRRVGVNVGVGAGTACVGVITAGLCVALATTGSTVGIIVGLCCCAVTGIGLIVFNVRNLIEG